MDNIQKQIDAIMDSVSGSAQLKDSAILDLSNYIRTTWESERISSRVLPQLFVDGYISPRVGSFEVCFPLTVHAGGLKHSLRILMTCFAYDLADLMINGDRNSEDPLLALTDGLKIRQDWPAGLLVHGFTCKVERPSDRLVSCDMRVHIAWLPELPEAPGDWGSVLPGLKSE